MVVVTLVGPAERPLLIRELATTPPSAHFALDLASLDFGLHLISALFVHISWPHLLGNVSFLLFFGVPIEQRIGAARLLAVYCFCGVLAAWTGLALLGQASAQLLGASGAVSGLIGIYIGLFPRSRLGLLLPLGVYFEYVRVPAVALIGLWVALQFLLSVTAAQFGLIAWWAHLTGFVCGAGFGLMLRGVR